MRRKSVLPLKATSLSASDCSDIPEMMRFGPKTPRQMLDDMHKRKIDMADSIYVINVGGYIGESTRSEIEYARKNGKAIQYLEPEK